MSIEIKTEERAVTETVERLVLVCDGCGRETIGERDGDYMEPTDGKDWTIAVMKTGRVSLPIRFTPDTPKSMIAACSPVCLVNALIDRHDLFINDDHEVAVDEIDDLGFAPVSVDPQTVADYMDSLNEHAEKSGRLGPEIEAPPMLDLTSLAPALYAEHDKFTQTYEYKIDGPVEKLGIALAHAALRWAYEQVRDVIDKAGADAPIVERTKREMMARGFPAWADLVSLCHLPTEDPVVVGRSSMPGIYDRVAGGKFESPDYSRLGDDIAEAAKLHVGGHGRAESRISLTSNYQYPDGSYTFNPGDVVAIGDGEDMEFIRLGDVVPGTNHCEFDRCVRSWRPPVEVDDEEAEDTKESMDRVPHRPTFREMLATFYPRLVFFDDDEAPDTATEAATITMDHLSADAPRLVVDEAITLGPIGADGKPDWAERDGLRAVLETPRLVHLYQSRGKVMTEATSVIYRIRRNGGRVNRAVVSGETAHALGMMTIGRPAEDGDVVILGGQALIVKVDPDTLDGVVCFGYDPPGQTDEERAAEEVRSTLIGEYTCEVNEPLSCSDGDEEEDNR